MKRFFSITAVVMLLVVLVMGSCEKQDENQNAIEFLKNNATLEQVGFQTDEGFVGDLYSNEEQQIVLLSRSQIKTAIEPTGTLEVHFIDTPYGSTFELICTGIPTNCAERSAYFIIWKNN